VLAAFAAYTLEKKVSKIGAAGVKRPRPSRAVSLATALFPDPPRRIPRHRALSVLLRTAHLATFAVLLGGHVFDVDPLRLAPWLVATVASGAGLMALEMASSFAWLSTGKGLAVLVKLALLAAVPALWDHRVAILLAVVILAGISSHMPARFRHYQVVPMLRRPFGL